MSKEFKIGVFAISVLTVSFFLINYLRGEDIFNREFELSSRYADVQGLVASAPVYIKGYKAGKVSEVTYNSQTEDFEVVCSIRREFRVPADSRMVIYGVDIMGSKGVRIDLGSSEADAQDGDMLVSDYEAGLIDGIAGSLDTLISKVNDTIDSLGVTVSGINSLLSDANQTYMTNTLAHLEKTIANVESLSRMVEGRSDELSVFISNLSALSESIVAIAHKADSAMDGVNKTVASIAESDLQGMLSSLKNLIDNLNDPDGSVGKLFVDDSIYDSVDALLNDIDSLIQKIQENPKKYLRISVF